MLNKIAFLILCCFFSLNAEEPPHIYLKTPNFAQENIMGLNVGIRPVRKYGVRIETESIQDKLIIHNYGYGGSGLTLSFGGAKEVLEILNNQNPISKTVAILGGGVIGLTTAYDLLEQGYDVHIYADNWSPNLTSNVAAGIWSPLWLPEGTPEEQKILNQRMLEASEQRFLMSTGEQPEFAGVRFIDSYSFKSDSLQEAIKTKHRGEDVVVYFDNGVIKKGKRISELSIDGKLFMEDLFSKVKSKGARLKERHFGNLDDVLSLDESIIINCTSLGSRELFNDKEFIPVRGQIIYFKPQEGIDYLLYQNVSNDSSIWISIYPWSDRLILGGVYERGQEERVINNDTINKIIENAQKCFSGEI